MKKLEMRPNTTNGLLITFCGLDGCGKTTMIHRLMAELEQKHQVFLTKQPTDFVRQSAIFRTYMDSPNHDAYDYRSLSLLAASDRLQHVNKIIEPTMKQGQIVLSDRYFYSCLANLHARGFEEEQWIYEIAKSVIQPDIAFFFDVPVETAVTRVRSMTYTYNEEGQVLTGTDSMNICYFENTYDEYGRVATQKDAIAGSRTSIFEYGCCGERITTDRNGHQSTRIFDCNGLLTSYTDENGNTKTYEYDSRYEGSTSRDSFNERNACNTRYGIKTYQRTSSKT